MYDAGNEEGDGCSKQNNYDEERNRLLPADGMESSDIPDAQKENLNDYEESYLKQKQYQEVPYKPPTQGDMKQNVVKVQPGVNNSKSNSNNAPATHRSLYNDGGMDYKGESRDETPSKAEHLESKDDKTGKNGVHNLAGYKKINSEDGQANDGKQAAPSFQIQNISEEKKNTAERRSVLDRLGKKKEESAHHGQSNLGQNKRHSGDQNVSYLYVGLDKTANSLYLH